MAGRDVTEQLQTLLRKSGYILHTSAEKEVVRMIKEKCCYLAVEPRREEKEWAGIGLGGFGAGLGSRAVQEGKVIEYVLPDGHKLKVRYYYQGFKLRGCTSCVCAMC